MIIKFRVGFINNDNELVHEIVEADSRQEAKDKVQGLAHVKQVLTATVYEVVKAK